MILSKVELTLNKLLVLFLLPPIYGGRFVLWTFI